MIKTPKFPLFPKKSLVSKYINANAKWKKTLHIQYNAYVCIYTIYIYMKTQEKNILKWC